MYVVIKQRRTGCPLSPHWLYLTSKELLNPTQSKYSKHHNTETILTSLYDKLVIAIGRCRVVDDSEWGNPE